MKINDSKLNIIKTESPQTIMIFLRRLPVLLVVLWTGLKLLTRFVRASDPTQPHYHGGLLIPYDGSFIPIELTNNDKAKLKEGEAVSVLYIPRLLTCCQKSYLFN